MKISFIFILILLTSLLRAQDTFSIVAIDTITGEIGSAGASCIGGSKIISDVLPGRGAIHTQSYWHSTNQQNAHNRMIEGMSPQEIIDWLIAHDVQNNPGIRQYGIVDLDSAGRPRSAAFTGANCLNYKNHITGPNYAIQGNILLGQQILDSMEARFLNTEGMLAEKLMAALQGANVIGADIRCTSNGTSSLSAFIRVARPTDLIGNFYCDLNVPSVPAGVEPIDSLQALFDEWLGTVVGIWEDERIAEVMIYPNPAYSYIKVSGQQSAVSRQATRFDQQLIISVFTIYGQQLDEYSVDGHDPWDQRIDIQHYPAGIYLIRVVFADQHSYLGKFVVN